MKRLFRSVSKFFADIFGFFFLESNNVSKFHCGIGFMKITGEKLSQLECFSFGNKTDSGLKISKQKLTFLGWYGLHKLTPLVIGKALKKIKKSFNL